MKSRYNQFRLFFTGIICADYAMKPRKKHACRINGRHEPLIMKKHWETNFPG